MFSLNLPNKSFLFLFFFFFKCNHVNTLHNIIVILNMYIEKSQEDLSED